MSGQRTLSKIEMRDFTTEDYPRLLEVNNANYPDYPRSVNEQRKRDENIDKSKYMLRRYTFEDASTRRIIGFGELSHNPEQFHSQRFWINILVDPNEQAKGFGSHIYNSLIEQLRELDAILVSTFAKEDLQRQIQFYEHRGFKEAIRAWESRLDLKTAETMNFIEYLNKVANAGIQISTLAEEKLKNNPQFMRDLHELVQLVAADMPQSQPFTPLPYEQWEAFEMKNPSLMPDAYMIARDGDRLVGLSTLWSSEPEPKVLYQGNTGVRRDYRGRGIAIAMKLRVIEYAKKHGYEKLKTWNASNNAPMLGINTRLGFKRQVGWITFEKILTS